MSNLAEQIKDWAQSNIDANKPFLGDCDGCEAKVGSKARKKIENQVFERVLSKVQELSEQPEASEQ